MKRSIKIFSILILWFTCVTAITAGIPVKRTQWFKQPHRRSDIRSNNLSKNSSVCWVNNLSYNDQAPVPGRGPCEQCICNNTNVVCSIIKCDLKSTCKVIQKSQQCCPNYQCDCEHNGKFYLNGTKIDTSDTPCRSCYCKEGEITCSSIGCYQRDDCEGKIVPGNCCPQYDHCPTADVTEKLPLNETIKNNSQESWLMTTDSARTLEPDYLVTDNFDLDDDEVTEIVISPMRLELGSDAIPGQTLHRNNINSSSASSTSNLENSSLLSKNNHSNSFTPILNSSTPVSVHCIHLNNISVKDKHPHNSVSVKNSKLVLNSSVSHHQNISQESSVKKIQENLSQLYNSTSSVTSLISEGSTMEVTTTKIKFTNQNEHKITTGSTTSPIVNQKINVSTTERVDITIGNVSSTQNTIEVSTVQSNVNDQIKNSSDNNIKGFEFLNVSKLENKSNETTTMLSTPIEMILNASQNEEPVTMPDYQSFQVTTTKITAGLNKESHNVDDSNSTSIYSTLSSKLPSDHQINISFITTKNPSSQTNVSTSAHNFPADSETEIKRLEDHERNISSTTMKTNAGNDTVTSKYTSPFINFSMINLTSIFHHPSFNHSNWTFNYANLTDGQNYTELYSQQFMVNPVRFINTVNSVHLFASLGNGNHKKPVTDSINQTITTPTPTTNTTRALTTITTASKTLPTISTIIPITNSPSPITRFSSPVLKKFTTAKSVTLNTKYTTPTSAAYKILLDGKIKPITRPSNATIAPLSWLKGSSLNVAARKSNATYTTSPITNVTVTTESTHATLKNESRQEPAEAKVYDPLMPYPEEYPEEYQTIQNGPAIIITRTTYTRIPNVTYTTVTMATLPTYKQVQKAEEGFASTLFEGKNFGDRSFTKKTTPFLNKNKLFKTIR